MNSRRLIRSPRRRAGGKLSPASRSSSAIDNLLGGVIDHNRRFEILKVRVGAKHRFYAVLEGRSVRLFGGFNVLPQAGVPQVGPFYSGGGWGLLSDQTTSRRRAPARANAWLERAALDVV